jgi:hypothetical protein
MPSVKAYMCSCIYDSNFKITLRKKQKRKKERKKERKKVTKRNNLQTFCAVTRFSFSSFSLSCPFKSDKSCSNIFFSTVQSDFICKEER